MTSNRIRDRILFVLSDPGRIDLEWMFPLMDELASDGAKLDVFDFSAPVPLDNSNYWIRALRLIGCEPKLSADLEPIPSFLARALDRMRSSKTYFISSIGACYYSRKSPFNVLFPFTKWREAKRRARLTDILKSVGCVFVRLHEKDRPSTLPEGELVTHARECGVPVIGCPLVVDNQPWRSNRSVMRCEYALANTSQQADMLPVRKDTIACPITPPKFTRRWFGRIGELHERLAPPMRLPANRERALVILKNEQSGLWKGQNFHDTVRHLLDPLLAGGFFLVLKPHPRQSRATLNQILSGLTQDDYCIVDGPLLYWAQRVDRVISLPSGGILDALAVGKVPVLFWPMTDSYREQIRLGNVPETHVKFDKNGKLITRYDDFCHQVTTPKFEPAKSFDDTLALERFRSLYSTAPDCREIRALISTDDRKLESPGTRNRVQELS